MPPAVLPGQPDIGFFAGFGPNDTVEAVAVLANGRGNVLDRRRTARKRPQRHWILHWGHGRRGEGLLHDAEHLLARAFETGRRALAQRVDAAMDVGVRRLVELRHRVEHLLLPLAEQFHLDFWPAFFTSPILDIEYAVVVEREPRDFGEQQRSRNWRRWRNQYLPRPGSRVPNRSLSW